jgi:hypothetical protein
MTRDSDETEQEGNSSTRREAEWMCQLDERILEHLQADGPAGPERIAGEITGTASAERVIERCQRMEGAGLVWPDPVGWRYGITQLGELYLDGDLVGEALERAGELA